MTERVLVTGATGFVGSALCELLSRSGYTVRAALRTDRRLGEAVSEAAIVGDVTGATDWSSALRGVDVVVHAAARVHVMSDDPSAAALYMETNARGTRRLAEQCAAAGVRRVVFLSSVKVNGEDSGEGCYSVHDEPHPLDAYGESKLAAERYLKEVATYTSLEAAIIRSPLVYGPGVRANFLRLMRWVDREWPLPFGAVHNRRSLVSVWNLCDLLLHVLQRPQPTNGAWMAADGEDLATPELIKRLGIAMRRRVILAPIPPPLLRAGAALLGKGAEAARLCGSLVVDIASTHEELAWRPRVSVDEGLARTVTWYLREDRARER